MFYLFIYLYALFFLIIDHVCVTIFLFTLLRQLWVSYKKKKLKTNYKDGTVG